MLWILACHIISVICWFAGLFYLPRLFVYHADANDPISHERFCLMEHRLYYGIMLPAALLSIIFGVWLLSFNFAGYMQMGWLHAKLFSVLLLIIFQIYCGHCLKQFKNNNNKHNAKFYRILNEVPTVLLIAIVILVVVKPF